MEKILRIARWNEVFETSESRKYKVAKWVAIPANFASNGYQMLLDEFEPNDAAAIYGAWCALVIVAASCDTRGTLATSRKKPLPISHIARQTGFPVELIQRLFDWAVRPDVGWLIDADCGTEQETAENPCKNDDPRQSPGVPEESPGDPTKTPGYRTGQDKTEQHITRQDRTGHAADPVEAAGPVQSVPSSDVEFVVDFSRHRDEDIRDRCTRLSDALGKPADPNIKQAIWDLVWLACSLPNGEFGDILTSAKSQHIKRKLNWLVSVRDNKCAKYGLHWSGLASKVPKFTKPKPAMA